MKVIDTELPEVKLIEPKVFGDERGYFLESYNQKAFQEALGLDLEFVQDNHSFSRKNVLRGLHYQLTRPQGKLIRVLHGEVYDVAVDMREGSPNFGKHAAFRLSGDNKRMAWIPPGFAHGFLVLSETVDFLYKCTDFYNGADDRCLLWNDPAVGIQWPLEDKPLLSPKDAEGKTLEEAERYKNNFTFLRKPCL
jgi:dTDP-4-dehydrorhamnose 3,5-epimerase